MPTPKAFPNMPETFTVLEAAKVLGIHHRTIRDAIRRGDMEAFIIGGREPRRSGRGLGYRITREALQEWYFGGLKQKRPVGRPRKLDPVEVPE